MTCELLPGTYEFTQGDDVLMEVQMLNSLNGVTSPMDITLRDEIKAYFVNTDGTILTRTLSASGGITKVNAIAGIISITLTRAQTALIKSGEFQSFEVELISDNGQPAQKNKIVQFLKTLTIHPRMKC